MRHGLRLAAACAAVLACASAAQARPPIPFVDSDPDGPVYCPYGFLSGSAHFTNLDGSAGGLSNSPADHRYTITLDAECSFGTSEADANRRLQELLPPSTFGPVAVPISDDAGHYVLTLSGTATGHTPLGGTGETCAYGEGSDGAMTGYGPEGSITGRYTFQRFGPHYWVAGTFDSAGEVHKVNLWLDLTELQVSVDPRLPDVTHVDPNPDALVNAAVGAGKQALAVRGYLACSVEDGQLESSSVIGHGVIHDPGDPTTVVTDVANAAVEQAGGALRAIG